MLCAHECVCVVCRRACATCICFFFCVVKCLACEWVVRLAIVIKANMIRWIQEFNSSIESSVAIERIEVLLLHDFELVQLNDCIVQISKHTFTHRHYWTCRWWDWCVLIYAMIRRYSIISWLIIKSVDLGVDVTNETT